MAKRLSVVVSQSPSRNPAKRKLEEDIVARLLFEPGIDVTIVPNLYDIKPDSSGMLALKGVGGNMVVCSWLFERAAHWVLDRNNICGHVGPVLLKNEDENEEEMEGAEEDGKAEADKGNGKQRVVDSREIPDRKIYCLDLRISNRAQEFIDEVKRIQQANLVTLVTLGDVVNASPAPPSKEADGQELGESTIERIEEDGGRRWYPVIDYSRCTNCMECIDFCLFGVYGVDRIDTILVEQPDNCRKGCPACSRVCPENAIMFPQHKTPAIAGSNDGMASMKIDLSQLFGAPADGKSASEIAALERDEQLIAAGRDAVGIAVAVPKRHADKLDDPKDELDNLIDQLDDLDL